MNRRLIVILVVIAALMFGISKMAGDGSTDSQSKNGPLAAMVGKPAPDFLLKTHDGKDFALSQQRGKKVVLFFNEGIMCYPACWNQMAALGTDQKLNTSDVIAASIVTDTSEEWLQAIAKMPELGKGTILLDSDKKVSTAYDMLYLPSSMHRGSQPGHTYIVVDKEGVVRYTLDDPGMGIQNETLIKELEKI